MTRPYMRRMPQFSIYFTAKDGSFAKITGELAAIEAIEDILRAAGIKYNETVETWDAGFYNAPHG